MNILNRKEFLKLETPALFIKCDEFGNTNGELKILVEKSENDFVACGLHSFVKEWNGTQSPDDEYEVLKASLDNKDKQFEWDYSMNVRDGLFEEDQKFMIYGQLDLLKLMRELNRVYLYSYNKDDHAKYWI